MSLKAKLIHDALTEHSYKVMNNPRDYLVGKNRITEERIAIIDKFLGVESPVSVPSNVERLAQQMHLEAIMFFIEGAAAAKSEQDMLIERFQQQIIQRLTSFRNACRAEVLDEVAKGSGAADEMLRKATEGTK